jgi:hypothetical protein
MGLTSSARITGSASDAGTAIFVELQRAAQRDATFTRFLVCFDRPEVAEIAKAAGESLTDESYGNLAHGMAERARSGHGYPATRAELASLFERQALASSATLRRREAALEVVWRLAARRASEGDPTSAGRFRDFLQKMLSLHGAGTLIERIGREEADGLLK